MYSKELNLKKQLKYYRKLCFYMAIGLTMVATSDLLLEIGHNVCHVQDYVSGSTGIHTHRMGDRTVIHHEHTLIKKIDDALDEVAEKIPNQNNDVFQLMSFDNLKLIVQEDQDLISSKRFSSEYYTARLRYDQEFPSITSPPPQKS